MQAELVQLVEKKLEEALEVVDSATIEGVRAVWKGIGPMPTCPYIGDVMKEMYRVCGRGHVERVKAAREVIILTIPPLKDVLTPKAANEIMKVVEKSFPADQFLGMARSTKGVYERRCAPPQKFDERIFDLELSLMTVGAANLSRQAILSVRVTLDELLLQRAVGKPRWWGRLASFALPFMKWVFGILAAVITGALLFYIKGS